MTQSAVEAKKENIVKMGEIEQCSPQAKRVA